MQDFEGRAKWEFIWRVVTFFLQEDIRSGFVKWAHPLVGTPDGVVH